jgi:hypothetical protein
MRQQRLLRRLRPLHEQGAAMAVGLNSFSFTSGGMPVPLKIEPF